MSRSYQPRVRDQVRRLPGNARSHISFAHGLHVCIGMHLARIETQVAVRRLVERLPSPRLDPACPNAPRGLVFGKPSALHALWD